LVEYWFGFSFFPFVLAGRYICPDETDNPGRLILMSTSRKSRDNLHRIVNMLANVIGERNAKKMWGFKRPRISS